MLRNCILYHFKVNNDEIIITGNIEISILDENILNLIKLTGTFMKNESAFARLFLSVFIKSSSIGLHVNQPIASTNCYIAVMEKAATFSMSRPFSVFEPKRVAVICVCK